MGQRFHQKSSRTVSPPCSAGVASPDRTHVNSSGSTVDARRGYDLSCLSTSWNLATASFFPSRCVGGEKNGEVKGVTADARKSYRCTSWPCGTPGDKKIPLTPFFTVFFHPGPLEGCFSEGFGKDTTPRAEIFVQFTLGHTRHPKPYGLKQAEGSLRRHVPYNSASVGTGRYASVHVTVGNPRG